MKIVTINIPDQYLDAIKILVDLGYFPSRSEAVREAIKFFLQNEEKFTGSIDQEAFFNQQLEYAEAL